MKLQRKPPEKDSKTRGDLIKYFDDCWLTQTELLTTEEAIKGKLNINAIRMRLRSKKVDTLEKLLRPKEKYILSKKSGSSDFKKCSKELIKNMESGSNHILLNGIKTIKIRGTFSIPNAHNKPLVIKEFVVDKEKYLKTKDKDGFLRLSFLHSIKERIVVKCEVENN
jgi:uncharacterized protein YbcI